jgi:hypothetical protein
LNFIEKHRLWNMFVATKILNSKKCYHN